jgi:hypothetical protein
MDALGMPCDDVSPDGETAARKQAREIAARLVTEDETYPADDLENRKIIALVAYLLRLGTDITNLQPDDDDEDALLIGTASPWGAR